MAVFELIAELEKHDVDAEVRLKCCDRDGIITVEDVVDHGEYVYII